MIRCLVENNIPHFVSKSFVLNGHGLISEYHTSEYYVYISRDVKELPLKKTWYKDVDFPTIKYRKIKEDALDFFKSNIDLYKLESNNKHGRIYSFMLAELDVQSMQKETFVSYVSRLTFL